MLQKLYIGMHSRHCVFFEDLGTRTLSRLLLMAFSIIQDDFSVMAPE